ncbi:hypothetical protein FRC17_006248, partial [Serendipita sp. 399]
MSAISNGRQRPSHDEDDITDLYLRAVGTFQKGDQDLPGSRPHTLDAATTVNRMSQPGYEHQSHLSSYPTLAPPTAAVPPRTPGGGRSRPLPVLPGGVVPPRPPMPSYGSDEKARLSASSSHSYGNRPFDQNSHTTSQTQAQPYTNANYSSTAYYDRPPYPTHRANNSDVTNSSLNHSNFNPVESYTNHTSTFPQDHQYSAETEYTSPANHYADSTPHYSAPSPNATPTRSDHVTGGPMGSQASFHSTSSYDGYYGQPAQAPMGYARSDQYHSQAQVHPSPESDTNHGGSRYAQYPQRVSDVSADTGYETGNYLLGTNGTNSSYASLLQEPRHSPTVDSNLLTPTSNRQNPILYDQPSGTSTSYQPPTPRDYSSQNTYASYGGPAIVTTTATGDQRTSTSRRSQNEYRRIASMKRPLELHEDDEDEDEDVEEDRFVNLSLLSHLANRLRDRVPRGTHVKGSIPYPRAFTGKDIVSTIQLQIQKELQNNMGFQTSDRRAALQVARSLQSQLFFYEVEWGGRLLQDGLEDVYMFLDDNPVSEGNIEGYRMEREELPTGVITLLTKCYAPSCQEGSACYSYSCPRRESALTLESHLSSSTPAPEPVPDMPWGQMVDKQTLDSLPEAEVRRQT